MGNKGDRYNKEIQALHMLHGNTHKKINRIIVLALLLGISAWSGCGKTMIDYAPPEDASYRGEDIEIPLPCGDILAGTLTYPKEISDKIPAVVLITGSSAHDRDNGKPDQSQDAYRPFRQIAHHLSSRGVAVLRMDDRGVGASSGGDIDEMTTPERAEDIKECIQYLRGRPKIDGDRIGLVGLSEGASIAHMIAAEDTAIAGIALLTGIGSPGRVVLEYQIENGLIEDLPGLLETDRNLRYLYDFDPLETAGLVKQPVLILQGETDRRVPPGDAYRLQEAIQNNGNQNVTVMVLPDHNHLLLKESDTGTETEYGRLSSNQVPDAVLEIIVEWVLSEI